MSGSSGMTFRKGDNVRLLKAALDARKCQLAPKGSKGTVIALMHGPRGDGPISGYVVHLGAPVFRVVTAELHQVEAD